MKTLGYGRDTDETLRSRDTTGISSAGGAAHGLWPSADEWRRLAPTFRWSPREAQVVRLLLTGVTRKVIAGQLGLSLNTVHTHVRRALFKCGCADLVALAWLVVAERDALRGYAREADVPGA